MRPVAVRRKSNFARRLVVLGAAIPAVVALFVDAPVPAQVRALITVLWILSLGPLYMYFGTAPEKRRPLPFFPAISAMYAGSPNRISWRSLKSAWLAVSR